jgi:hypothetical protein
MESKYANERTINIVIDWNVKLTIMEHFVMGSGLF